MIWQLPSSSAIRLRSCIWAELSRLARLERSMLIRSIRIPRLCSRLFLYRIRMGEQRRCYLGARCPMLFIHLRDAGFIRDALLFLRLVAGRRGTLSTFWMSTYQTRRGRGMTRLFWDLSRTGGQKVYSVVSKPIR